MAENNNCYRELILNSSYPIVFRECLNWEILKWNIEDWSSVFKNQHLPFRVADRICRRQPVWETSCRTENHTMQELIEFCLNKEKTEREWWYLDYKHIPELIPSFKQLFQTLSWHDVGFPDKGAECSTLWVGTPGAHTPCHYDSYGCNIVAQVLGRKRWLLFPPTQSKILRPTRVPYEESSVYSNINFSCREQIKDSELTKCYKIDLNPGDVLLVPHKWWHYVENLSLAISINTWITQLMLFCHMYPLKADDDIHRLEEALVRYLISLITEDLPTDLRKVILNPNELDIENSSFLLDLIKYCKEKCQQMEKVKNCSPEFLGNFQSVYHNHNYRFVRETPIIGTEFDSDEHFERCNRKEFGKNDHNDKSAVYNVECLESVVNAFCHPEIISQIKNKILKY